MHASPSNTHSTSNHVDVLLIGDSTTKDMPTNFIKNKRTSVRTLRSKYLSSAEKYIKNSNLTPDSIILQVAADHLAEEKLQWSISSFESLLSSTKKHFPKSKACRKLGIKLSSGKSIIKNYLENGFKIGKR